MKIQKSRLKDIVKNYEIVEQDFEYAGTKGIAELLAYQVIFFRKEDDLDNIVAISIDEIEDARLFHTANVILKAIDMNIRLGDNIETINGIYGKADFTDSIIENMIRYHYIISPDLFLSFGLRNNVLSSLEIVTDKNMIEEIVSVRKYIKD